MSYEFPKAKLIEVKFHLHWSRWLYTRMSNAAGFYFGPLRVVWRMPWLPKAAYQVGWDACWRQLNGYNPDPFPQHMRQENFTWDESEADDE